MYDPSAPYYDKIYSFKDYAAETEKLLALIDKYRAAPARTLLDVACGTGKHIAHLKQHFTVSGLDQSAGLLEVASAAHPDLTFHQGDMRAFDLGRTFDVVTCLFSSIGYMKTVEELAQAIGCMARHLAPGGVLIVEPWFTPEAWHPGFVHAMLVEEPELKVARMSTSMARGNLSYFDFHFLVGTPKGVEHFVEHHEMGLFTVDEMRAAVTGSGLRSEWDPEGLDGRGLHVGIR
jgi:ubiquinone/menaquinone biosynthesis C-methylase UbiE